MIACPFSRYNPSNLGIESGSKRKNPALGDGFLPTLLHGAPPKLPMWNQQAQNILVFRAGICQTQ
jgi:hypothetical protein